MNTTRLIDKHTEATQKRVNFAFLSGREFAVPVLVVLLLVWISLHNFLLFHTLAEFFTITVAILLSVVAWQTYAFSRNDFLMYMGTGYFWVATIDLLHALTYNGVAIILYGDTSTSTQYWLVARLIEAILLLSAPMFLQRKANRYAVFFFYGVLTLCFYLLISNGLFPETYIHDVGLTAFKVFSEYFIVFLLGLAGLFIYRYRTLIDSRVRGLLLCSIGFTIAAELVFTLYVNVNGTIILIGHMFKFFSFWLIFVAIVRTSLKEPFQLMAKASSTYDAIPVSTIVIDKNGLVQQVNRAACEQTSEKAENMLGRHYHELFHSADLHVEQCPVCERMNKGVEVKALELQLSGEAGWREFTISRHLGVGQNDLFVHVSRDISARKRAEKELLRQSQFDPLTNLPNRLLCTDRLAQIIKNAHRHKRMSAVMFLDLDNFKQINDTQGHITGDTVLVEVADILKDLTREGDTVGRWGGDEFVVLLPEVENESELEILSERILDALAKPIVVSGREYNITASLGISCYPTDGKQADVLLSNADAAMFSAKAAGKHTFHFFEEKMNSNAQARMEMEDELVHAIERNELQLVFQPLVDIATNRIVGAEALLRWNNKKLGNVRPDIFIPVAEDTGLIEPIGRWVLQHACLAKRQWIDRGYSDISLAVNISSKQLRHPGFLDFVEENIRQYNINPKLLDFEITETLLLDNNVENNKVLYSLRKAGINISLDDFGTGYSSLNYLKNFPFSIVKIDRSFVKDIPEKQDDAALCKAIIAMADSLGLNVIAEGVETQAQLDFLRDSGVSLVQGYYFSPPVPREDFLALLPGFSD